MMQVLALLCGLFISLVRSPWKAPTELTTDRLYLLSSFGLRGFTDAGIGNTISELDASRFIQAPRVPCPNDMATLEHTHHMSGCPGEGGREETTCDIRLNFARWVTNPTPFLPVVGFSSPEIEVGCSMETLAVTKEKGGFFYPADHQTLEEIVQRGCGVFIHGDIQNATGTNSVQSALVDSALSKGMH